MSTAIFTNNAKNKTMGGQGKGWAQIGPQQMRCSLCRGELYPGDPYFELDGQAVCEDCLGRYARGYFIHRLRRVGREGRRERDDTI